MRRVVEQGQHELQPFADDPLVVGDDDGHHGIRSHTRYPSPDVPGGYGDTGFQVSGLKFPTAGCWQVAGTVGGKTLTFVVNVAAR